MYLSRKYLAINDPTLSKPLKWGHAYLSISFKIYIHYLWCLYDHHGWLHFISEQGQCTLQCSLASIPFKWPGSIKPLYFHENVQQLTKQNTIIHAWDRPTTFLHYAVNYHDIAFIIPLLWIIFTYLVAY